MNATRMLTARFIGFAYPRFYGAWDVLSCRDAMQDPPVIV